MDCACDTDACLSVNRVRRTQRIDIRRTVLCGRGFVLGLMQTWAPRGGPHVGGASRLVGLCMVSGSCRPEAPSNSILEWVQPPLTTVCPKW